MKKSLFKSIRFKFIIAICISMSINSIVEFHLFYIAYFYLPAETFKLWVNSNLIAFYILSILIFFIGTVFFFFLMTQRNMRYFDSIINAIENLANGSFGNSIPIKSHDELSILAKSVNTMDEKLKDFIEKERNQEKAKNDLLNSISHDLRTPLTPIFGYLKLITAKKYKTEEELSNYAEMIYKKCEDLGELINDLFEYSMLTSKDIKLNKVKINLYELVQQVVMEFQPVLDDNSMECRINSAQMDDFISADSGMMVRLFENLISNAIRYGKKGKYIDIDIGHNGLSVYVNITNYGIKIPQNDLEHIFDKFYRIEKSRSKVTGGTGLGLAIVKNIIELHGGKIFAESYDNKIVFKVIMKCFVSNS